MSKVNWPAKDGWYWVLFEGYDSPNPCWFMKGDDEEDNCFLPGGMGDSSSSGVYADDIEKVGPEIIEPKF